ncbi:unnamed protein product [Wuchereria bancrofti]|uniref:Uncharacterized protein n=1 Tax=Wuchereria bancrofti TaxID=6293 RepID=A0A3P7DRH5_WUCBA|nr:unnamed protein product [Wuchereria bancrofti]
MVACFKFQSLNNNANSGIGAAVPDNRADQANRANQYPYQSVTNEIKIDAKNNILMMRKRKNTFALVITSDHRQLT